MFVLSNIFAGLTSIVDNVIWLYTWLIIIGAVLSWIRPDPYNPIVRTIYALTEPVLWRVRRLLPFLYINGIDLSPVAVILALQFLSIALVRTLARLAVITA